MREEMRSALSCPYIYDKYGSLYKAQVKERRNEISSKLSIYDKYGSLQSRSTGKREKK